MYYSRFKFHSICYLLYLYFYIIHYNNYIRHILSVFVTIKISLKILSLSNQFTNQILLFFKSVIIWHCSIIDNILGGY